MARKSGPAVRVKMKFAIAMAVYDTETLAQTRGLHRELCLGAYRVPMLCLGTQSWALSRPANARLSAKNVPRASMRTRRGAACALTALPVGIRTASTRRIARSALGPRFL